VIASLIVPLLPRYF